MIPADLNAAQRLYYPWLADAMGAAAAGLRPPAPRLAGTPARRRIDRQRRAGRAYARVLFLARVARVGLRGVPPKHLNAHARRRAIAAVAA